MIALYNTVRDCIRIKEFLTTGSNVSFGWYQCNLDEGRSITNVLCDRHINERFKWRILCRVFRPIAFCNPECWSTTKYNKQCLAIMEIKMLLWISGVARYVHIRNENIHDIGKAVTCVVCVTFTFFMTSQYVQCVGVHCICSLWHRPVILSPSRAKNVHMWTLLLWSFPVSLHLKF